MTTIEIDQKKLNEVFTKIDNLKKSSETNSLTELGKEIFLIMSEIENFSDLPREDLKLLSKKIRFIQEIFSRKKKEILSELESINNMSEAQDQYQKNLEL